MFSILAKEKVVGFTEFELGDPPMGVAFGRMFPAADFGVFLANPENVEVFHEDGLVRLAGLSACTSTGLVLECAGVGLFISDVDGSREYEVTALGIIAPPYEELFPGHVEAYERHFR